MPAPLDIALSAKLRIFGISACTLFALKWKVRNWSVAAIWFKSAANDRNGVGSGHESPKFVIPDSIRDP